MKSHLVSALAVQSVGGERTPIKAARHLEGLDVLSCAQATGALSDDARQTHLLLHINLRSTAKVLVNSKVTSSEKRFGLIL